MKYAVLVALLAITSAFAQSLDGGSIARAGVHDLGLKSSQALSHNPAILASAREQRYIIEFLNTGAAVVNSAFSTSYWNKNFAGDQYIGAETKQDILDKIGSEGVTLDGRATAPLAGIAYNHFAVRVALESYASGLVPRDAVEVLLSGNELGKEYSVSALRGEAASYLDVAMGLGHAFQQTRFKTLAAGIAAHYYQGLDLHKLTQTSGTFNVTDSLITGSAYLRSAESTDGNGVGFDVGALAEFNDKWSLGLSLRQIGVRTSWTIKNNDIFAGEIDSLGVNIDSLNQDGYLERVFHKTDTSFAGGTLDTRLPSVLYLNGRFAPNAKWNFNGEFSYASRGAPTDEADIALGVAAQWRARNWLALQNGFALGSLWKAQVGLGAGLRFSGYELDLGWSWNGGMFNHARGMSVGMTHRIMF